MLKQLVLFFGERKNTNPNEVFAKLHAFITAFAVKYEQFTRKQGGSKGKHRRERRDVCCRVCTCLVAESMCALLRRLRMRKGLSTTSLPSYAAAISLTR